MADRLWDDYRVSIGNFTEQGAEAMNKTLKDWFNNHSNHWRSAEAVSNMFGMSKTSGASRSFPLFLIS